jgi:hypothetical protein
MEESAFSLEQDIGGVTLRFGKNRALSRLHDAVVKANVPSAKSLSFRYRPRGATQPRLPNGNYAAKAVIWFQLSGGHFRPGAVIGRSIGFTA